MAQRWGAGHYQCYDDAELAVLARSGSAEAFGALANRHYGPVYGVAYAWTGNRQDAEDLVQEALYVAFERLQSLRDPAYLPGLAAADHTEPVSHVEALGKADGVTR